jgi:hypothetical protein
MKMAVVDQMMVAVSAMMNPRDFFVIASPKKTALCKATVFW